MQLPDRLCGDGSDLSRNTEEGPMLRSSPPYHCGILDAAILQEKPNGKKRLVALVLLQPVIGIPVKLREKKKRRRDFHAVSE